MSSNDIHTLSYLLIPFFIVIAIIIISFLRRTRAQDVDDSYYLKDIKPFSIDLTKTLLDIFSKNVKWLKWAPLIAIIALDFLLIFMIIIQNGPDGFTEFINTDFSSFNIYTLIIALTSIGGIIAHFGIRPEINERLKALELASHNKLIFELSDEGIRAPVFTLTNPAFWRATEKNLHEVFIPFSDIELIEIFPSAGKARAQYLLKVKGESEYLGTGSVANIKFGFGILREHLRSHEQKIISFLKIKLNDRLVIRDQVEKSNSSLSI